MVSGDFAGITASCTSAWETTTTPSRTCWILWMASQTRTSFQRSTWSAGIIRSPYTPERRAKNGDHHTVWTLGVSEDAIWPWNAAQMFQRLMNGILQGLPHVFVDIDDILIASNSPEEQVTPTGDFWQTAGQWSYWPREVQHSVMHYDSMHLHLALRSRIHTLISAECVRFKACGFRWVYNWMCANKSLFPGTRSSVFTPEEYLQDNELRVETIFKNK